MSYFLGFDGGGTKTDCVLLDQSAATLGEGHGGPANPLRCGYDVAFASLQEAAAQALAAAKIRASQVTHVCAGVAGAARRSVVSRIMVFLANEFRGATTQVVPDYEIALETAAGPGLGVVLIAGTGSVAYGRNAAGETARVGGHGPWIGDEGSAFDIGRRALAAVVRTRDSGAPAPAMAEMISRALGCSDWDELLTQIMKAPDEAFPKLFPVVLEAAKNGDAAAKEILSQSAVGLGSLAAALIHRLGMSDAEFTLTKCGGVFGRSPLLDLQVDAALRAAAPRARIARLEISPAVGAAHMAARLPASSSETALHGS